VVPSGHYWDDLKSLGLPLYILLDDKLVIVLFKEWRKRRGKGTTKQCYYHLEDGRIVHSSKFRHCNIKTLSRESKINSILDGNW
jgi:hypothetical protein